MAKFPKPLEDGDSFELRDLVPMTHVCCDCGLVHRWQVKHTKNARVTVVTTRRDNRATGQRRRNIGKEKALILANRLIEDLDNRLGELDEITQDELRKSWQLIIQKEG